ncbi:MAG: hypothetical protein ABSB59_09380 [Streptosporangiaceae bacterium]
MGAHFEPPVPPSIARLLPGAVPRAWLDSRVDSALCAGPGGSIALVTGEPGCGKTVFAALAAMRWNCPCLILRGGAVGGTIAADPKNALIMLGLQLRDRYGPEIFGGPALHIRTDTTAGDVTSSGTLAGTDIGRVSLSPFKRVLIESELRVETLAGEAVNVRIGELTDAAAELSVAQLARDAIIDPLRRLARIRPDARVRIVIDALDESPDLARSLPLGAELPENSSWLITTRPGSYLDRFVPDIDGQITRISLDAAELRRPQLADAADYVRRRLTDPAVADAVQRQLEGTLDDTVRAIAEASDGNFLYLRHMLFGLEEATPAGRLLPQLTGNIPLPRGLEAIYRYFVSQHVHTSGDTAFRRVLGVMAVQFEPLTAGQLAWLADVESAFVDNALNLITQFIERAEIPGDLTFTFYHHSFAEFLLTQDRSRNPFPLEPSREHHLRIGSHYAAFADADWQRCSDLYALTHLPDHLATAGAVGQLSALAGGEFLRRQWEVVGPSSAHATTMATARLAADDGQDEIFLDMLARARDLTADMDDEWEGGRFVLGLLTGDPAAEIRMRTGGRRLPWSAFLCVERLLDLGHDSQALELLDSLPGRPWPKYRPDRSFSSRGIHGVVPEGLIFDIPDDEAASFLGRVAELDASLALRLNQRLYGESPWNQIPNLQTRWRDTLSALITREPAPAACRKAVDVTVAWMAKRPYPVGRAGVADALFVLMRRVAAAAPGDTSWFASRLAVTVKMRYESVTGLRADRWLDGATANLAGLVGLIDAAPAHSDLRGFVLQGVKGLVEGLPPLDMPATFSYDRRAAMLGHYAYLLERAGLRQWHRAAQVALRACELDASSDDAPLPAIAEALHWLGQMADTKTTARARVLAGQLQLTEEAGRFGTPAEPRAVSLEALGRAHSAYSRGKMALRLWQQGSASLDSLTQALAAAPPEHAKPEPGSRPPLTDLVAEAVSQAVSPLPVSWAMDAATRLDQARTEARRDRTTFDLWGFLVHRFRALAQLGAADLLLAELTATRTSALADNDVNMLVLCCRLAAVNDADVALSWWDELVPRLHPEDLGAAAATVATAFADSHPDQLARFDVGEIAPEGAVDICSLWLPHQALRPRLARVMRDMASRLDQAEPEGQTLAAQLWLATGISRDDEQLSAIAGDMTARILAAWQADNGLAEKLLAVPEDAPEAVPGPGTDAVVTILGHFLDDRENRGQEPEEADFGDLAGQPLSASGPVTLPAATRLKPLAATLSASCYENALADWLGTLDSERGDPSGFQVIVQSIASAVEREFRSPRERRLFETATRLASWCAHPPSSPGALIDLERTVSRIPDQDLRSLLMAPVATAWLRVRDHLRAQAVADLADLAALHRASYLNQLRIAGSPREHVIALATRSQEEDPSPALEDLLFAWFTIRLRDGDPHALLDRMERWLAEHRPSR